MVGKTLCYLVVKPPSSGYFTKMAELKCLPSDHERFAVQLLGSFSAV